MMKWHKIGFARDLNVSHSYKVKYVIPSVTEKDDGKYMCEIQRAIVSYTANNTIVVKSQGTQNVMFIRIQRLTKTGVVPRQTFSFTGHINSVEKFTDNFQSTY